MTHWLDVCRWWGCKEIEGSEGEVGWVGEGDLWFGAGQGEG